MAKQYENKNEIVEDVYILPGTWRNFSGSKDKYNEHPMPYFSVTLHKKDADRLSERGFNVKIPKPNPEYDEEGTEREPFITVKVNMNGSHPPRVVMRTTRKDQTLKGDMIGILDSANITHADMIIRPYDWDKTGEQAPTAYLQSLYVDIEEDYLADKYARLAEERDRVREGQLGA